MNTIMKVFNEGSKSYDTNRKKLIPCFDRFYSTALAQINKTQDMPIRVLDLGAGTGLVSYFLLQLFPNAHITLIDLSEGMLEIAKNRLNPWKNQIEIIEANYVDYSFSTQYDVVISALSIHHLEEKDKQVLYKQVFDCLKPGGQFINADQVLGPTATIESEYRNRWIQEVKASGISEVELAQALERMKEDKMSTLEDQLKWLRNIGFEEVHCSFQDYSFVVFSGEK